MRNSAYAVLFAAVLLAAGGVGCERSPTQPAIPGLGKAQTRVEISGPSTIPPGETARFRATSFAPGRPERDVTSEAIWRSSDPSLVSIDAAGLATGRKGGDATITATLEIYQASKPVLIIPAGTYRLSGTVREAGALPLVNARVEARAQSATVIETVTDAAGQFKLYGVPPDAELRVSKDGYAAHVQQLHLADHGSVGVELALASPRPDVSGTYTLAVGSDTCTNSAGPLKPELRRRTYQAVVTQTGAQLKVTLSGAEFRLVRGSAANGFSGTLDPSGAKFQLAPGDYYYLYSRSGGAPDVIEQLPDNTSLLVTGSATTTLSSRGMTGTLNGALEAHAGTVSAGPITGRCTSANHSFVFAR